MRLTITIKEPSTKEEVEAYYLLRYQMLRKPWGKLKGSEKDEREDESIHIMAVNNHQELVGVCRLHFNGEEEAQIRYMAVDPYEQRKGIGHLMILNAENRAATAGARRVILHSREDAIEFYKKCGYHLIDKSYLMWGQIQHYLMEKWI